MWQLPPAFYNGLQYLVHGDYGVLGGKIAEAYRRHRPGKALELGWGTGLLSKFFKAGEYTGIDHDSARIELARRQHLGHEFVVGDATDLDPEFIARFAFVFCHGWIHHLEDSQIRRILGQIESAAGRSGRAIEFLVLEPLMPDRPWRNPVGYGIASADRGGRLRTRNAMEKLLGSGVYEVKPSKLLWY